MRADSILIVGKGPSSNRIITKDNGFIVAALNNSISICEHVDYLFMNDFECIKKITVSDFIKAPNIIIPTYPHYKEKASYYLTWKNFVCLLPIIRGWKPKIYLYQLHTSPILYHNIPYFGKIHSVSETAIAWFLSLGYRDFTTVGVSTYPGYSTLIDDIPPENQDCRWLSRNYDSILNRIECSNSTILVV